MNFMATPPPPPAFFATGGYYEQEEKELPYILKALAGNVFYSTKYKGKDINFFQDRPKVDIYAHEINEDLYGRVKHPEPIQREGLSGGQWQRLALARSFMRIKEADLLILDEPSSALDPQAEYQVFKAIMELRKNKTTLFIVSSRFPFINL
jgi:ABC-type transport system involved in cytochrome bd biosynthesis fused ATPase/permease subunit